MRTHLLKMAIHLRLAGTVGVLAGLIHLARTNPPPPTLRGVSEVLGRASSTVVEPTEFVWEPSHGRLVDAVWGRRVLFLGRAAVGAPRDLYRARVRVTVEGMPLQVVQTVNLTQTPLGDEQALVASGEHAAFATASYGSVQQVTVLGLAGGVAESDDRVQRITHQLENWRTTASWDGLSRVEISSPGPSRAASLTLSGPALAVALNGGRTTFRVDLNAGELMQEGLRGAADISILKVPTLAKPPVLWAVDTVRAYTGPEAIAWLEDHVFAIKDLARRTGYEMGGEGQAQRREVVSAAPPPPPEPPKPVVTGGFASDTSWPPQNLRSIFKQTEENEGVWGVPKHKFLPTQAWADGIDAPPPYFMETFVRPDPERPYVRVWLVAMDSRQLALGMQGGIEDPQPLTGARGEGRIPRDPKVLQNAVGAFNGGFKTTHGEYGMMVDRRVLLPPKAGAATVAVTEDGRAQFGTWPESTEISPDIVSFRQNLEPLIEDGVVNPQKRSQWGWHSHTTGMLTHRSALCLTHQGHMVYAWGAETTGETLANGLVMAGCKYGIHLDMNPKHTAFAYLRVKGPGSSGRSAALLHQDMAVLPERFILWSPKDFFYLLRRDFGPPDVGVTMRPAQTLQPPPTWAPAIFEGEDRVGGDKVKLVAIRRDRVQVEVRAGARDTTKQELSRLDEERTGRLLASFIIGTGEHENCWGIKVAGTSVCRWNGHASLVADNGKISIIDSKSDISGASAVELPVLFSGGSSPQSLAGSTAKGRRAALCEAGEFLWMSYGDSVHSASLVQSLRKVGCQLIVGLEQGDGTSEVRFGGGSSNVLLDQYDRPVIHLLGTGLALGAGSQKSATR